MKNEAVVQVKFFFKEEKGSINVYHEDVVENVSSLVQEIKENILTIVQQVEKDGYLSYAKDGIFAKSLEKDIKEKIKQHKCCGGKCKKNNKEECNKEECNKVKEFLNEEIKKTSKDFVCKKESNLIQDENSISIEIGLIDEEISIGLRSNSSIDVNSLNNVQSMALMVIDNLSHIYQMA